MGKTKCIDCPHFHIRQKPLPHHYGTGLAVCEKYDLVADFYDHRKLNRLECVKEE